MIRQSTSHPTPPAPFPRTIHRSIRWLIAVAALLLIGGVAGTSSFAHPAGPSVVPGSAAPRDEGTEILPFGAYTQTVLTNMNGPVAMAFDPTGRLFYTEKTGAVRLFQNGVLQPAPVIAFSVDSQAERGLLGIAIDPNFASNHYIYVYYTCDPAGGACTIVQNQVVRFVENNGVGSNSQILFTSPVLGTVPIHNGGNIHFGPDGKLYITVGDGGNTPEYAQDVTRTNGKIHRLNPDGSIPLDNPVFTQTGALPSLWAMGLRNSFDFAFDPFNGGQIFASENGPTCDDEMNRILPGYNYGWRPNYPCDDPTPDPTYNTIPPLWSVPAAGPACCLAPTGILVYAGSSIPEWRSGVFMATYNSSQLRHFYLSADRTRLVSSNVVLGVQANMDIETGPDGALWVIQGGGWTTGSLVRIVGTGGTPTATATSTATRTPITTPTWTATPTVAVSPPPTLTPCGISFSDVPQGSTFYNYIECLACQGILGGYVDGTFHPADNVTRGQLAKIVANSAGWNDTPSGQIFSDVSNRSVFYAFVQRMASRGYISGYPCGGTNPQTGLAEPCDISQRPYFRPNNFSSRGQIAKIVAQSRGLSTAAGVQRYADVPADSTFYLWINQLSDAGAISGYPCGGPGEPCTGGSLPYFRPAAPASRGQTAKIVSSLFFPACATLGAAP